MPKEQTEVYRTLWALLCYMKSDECKNAESENSDPLLTDDEDDGDININM